jgi:hypothetical protein
MIPLHILLPIILVVLAFLLKLLVDRSATAPAIVQSTYELPVSIVFLALSFATAFTITGSANIAKGMTNCYILLIVAILAVVMWRRSLLLFEHNHRVWSVLLFALNIAIASYSLMTSIELIAGAQQ